MDGGAGEATFSLSVAVLNSALTATALTLSDLSYDGTKGKKKKKDFLYFTALNFKPLEGRH